MAIVMIVDDEPLQRDMLQEMAEKMGHSCITLKDGQEAVDYLLWNKSPAPDAILLDLFMPGTDGLTVIRALQGTHAGLPIIALSMHGTTRHSLQAIKMGAYDYVPKPVTSERLEVAIANALRTRQMARELEQLKPSAQLCLSPASHTGFSDSWLHVVSCAAEEAKHDGTLIIKGETGVGKIVLARAIHMQGARKNKPFVVVDTAQDISSLNAILTSARGGTLAVSHTGHAPEAFLRGLEKLYYTMAEQNIRLIICLQSSPETAALNAVERFFNKDRAHTIHIPSLRERPQDIPLLARRFVEKAAHLLGRETPYFSPGLIESLQKYKWPGNIRELHGELFSCLLYSSAQELEPPACCQTLEAGFSFSPSQGKTPMIPLVTKEGTLRSLEEIEGEVINFALTYYNTSRSDIARMLGIGRTTLYRKAHQLHS